MYELPREHWDVGLQNTASRIEQETGKTVRFVVGALQVKGGEAKGIITGNQIIIRSDHLKYTPDQIADHEAFHDKVDRARVDNHTNIVSELQKKLLETYTPEQLQEKLEQYAAALEGYLDPNMTNDPAACEEVWERILEELLADAYSGMNWRGIGATEYTGVVNQYMTENGMGKGKIQENGTRQTNAPPVTQERYSADEQSDFSDVVMRQITENWGGSTADTQTSIEKENTTEENESSGVIEVNDMAEVDGELVVNIDSKESGLLTHRKSEWPALVAKMIRTTLSNKAIVTIDGDIIRVTNRGAREVSYGTDTQNIRTAARTKGDYSKLEQKMITAEHAASIITLSRYSSWSENTEDATDMFKRDGLNYRKVNLNIDGEPYVATVVTALNGDPRQPNVYGEKFYDIENIEKQTNISAKSGALVLRGVPHQIKIADSSSDMLTVTQKQRIVNNRKLKYSTGDNTEKTAFAIAMEKAEKQAKGKEKFSWDGEEDVQETGLPEQATKDLMEAIQSMSGKDIMNDEKLRSIIAQYTQDTTPVPKKPTYKVDKGNLKKAITSELGLTKEQTAQLKGILNQYAETGKPPKRETGKPKTDPKTEADIQVKATTSIRNLKRNLQTMFSIPAGSRAEVNSYIDRFAQRIVANEKLTYEDRQEFFRTMYEAGMMEVEADAIYAEGRSYMTSGRIYVNESLRQSLGDRWNELRQRAFAAGVYLTTDPNNGAGVDVWNQDLARQVPGLFDENETDMEVALERLIQVAEEGRSEMVSLPEYTAQLAKQEHISVSEILNTMEQQLDYTLRAFAESAGVEMDIKKATERQKAKGRSYIDILPKICHTIYKIARLSCEFAHRYLSGIMALFPEQFEFLP